MQNQANIISCDGNCQICEVLCEKSPKFQELLPLIKKESEILAKNIQEKVKKLKESEKQITLLSKFPEQNPNPVVRVTTDGEIVFHNKASVPLLDSWDYSDNFIHNPNILAILHPLANASEIFHSHEIVEELTYSLSFTPIKNTSFINIYGLDITKQEKIYLDIHERMKELDCLHNISQIIEADENLDQTFQAI